MVEAVLLDIDGTLLDSNGQHAAAWCDALAEEGYDIPVDRIRPMIGMGGDRILPAIDPKLRTGDGLGKRITDRQKAIFLERYIDSVEATSGARALLSELRARGITCVIASSAKRDELDRLLACGDFGPLIDDASTADDAASSKPAPDIVDAALHKAHAQAANAVMIGDTQYDIEAAHKAGVRAVALLCGGADPATLAQAEAIYRDPADVLAALDESPLML